MEEKSGVLFGKTLVGFKKSDVLAYVEELTASYEKELATAAKRVDAAERYASEISAREKADKGELVLIREELVHLKKENQSQKEELSKLREALKDTEDLRRALAEKDRSYRELIEKEKDRRDKLALLNEQVKEYEELKRKVAEIEMSAYQRAVKIENNAKDEAEAIRKKLAADLTEDEQAMKPAIADMDKCICDAEAAVAAARKCADALHEKMEGLQRKISSLSGEKKDEEDAASAETPGEDCANEEDSKGLKKEIAHSFHTMINRIRPSQQADKE